MVQCAVMFSSINTGHGSVSCNVSVYIYRAWFSVL